MIDRLLRIGLALAIAFVFTGRMEAAAVHCASLAKAAEQTAELAVADEAIPCHGAHTAGSTMDGAKPKHHDPGSDRCECLAALTACLAATPEPGSSRVEPYAWARPQTVSFASLDPSPDWRPPRA